MAIRKILIVEDQALARKYLLELCPVPTRRFAAAERDTLI